ncbi:MAG: cyclodeaminase/cyclohydrolase family protein [Thermodesulfobacteriota bacterium]
MEDLRNHTLEEWVRALARRDPVPAGGALALATLAGGAALAAKAARLSGRPAQAWEERAERFLAEAQRDGLLYKAAAGGDPGAAKASLEATLEALEEAVSLLEDLGPLFGGLGPSLTADVAAAERLARAGAQTLSLNLAANLSAWAARDPRLGAEAQRWLALRDRLEAA